MPYQQRLSIASKKENLMSNKPSSNQPANVPPPTNPANAPTSNPPATKTSAEKQPKSAAAIAALVLAIVALALSFLPIINNFAFLLVILAVIFGIVGTVGATRNKRSGFGIAIASLIIAIIAGAAVLGSQAMYSAAFDEASHELDKSTGAATEEVLGTDVEVKLGDLTLKKSSYGMIDSSMPVTVTNLTDNQASFQITVEAVDANGARITQDYIYANDLAAGQSQTFKIFTYISSDDYNAMKNAGFNIVSASVY